jgi:nicotinamidase-related amidase
MYDASNNGGALMANIQLLVIDPQVDFCDPDGALAVPGAEADMHRLATLVHRLRHRLDDVHVTLDSHRRVDISHPLWFRDGDGAHPDPFTQITAADLRTGRWSTTHPGTWDRTLAYLEALAAGGRYPHTLWPEHCLIGTEGHAVHPVLGEALAEWEARFALVDFVTKGSNPFTEHFSAVAAEVPDPEDPTTQINTALVTTLQQADVVLLAGEASSHCLAHTVRDIAAQFADPTWIAKLVLLEDATSPVPGFEALADDFVRDMTALGMRTTTTDQFLRAA